MQLCVPRVRVRGQCQCKGETEVGRRASRDPQNSATAGRLKCSTGWSTHPCCDWLYTLLQEANHSPSRAKP